ncbi:MAG: hypothetical protein CMI32_03315 [Opitutales bacterium]|nr:hypothetical protein [Opitutales bacterium]|tara:strand:- start:1476 stop:2009 length:534 start_codon:yes stop_codon:yes gene_type:complete
MEVDPTQIEAQTDLAQKELQLKGEDKPDIEIPENGRESSVKVTQAAEDAPISPELPQVSLSEKSGVVDNIEETGEDSTRDPSWRVLEGDEFVPLSSEAAGDLHNAERWDERDADRQREDVTQQERMIEEEERKHLDASKPADYQGRPNSNETLDPYYQTGNQPSDPPSSGRSLDSFA